MVIEGGVVTYDIEDCCQWSDDHVKRDGYVLETQVVEWNHADKDEREWKYFSGDFEIDFEGWECDVALAGETG